MEAVTGATVLYSALGGTWMCIGTVLFLYNVVALIKYMREDSDESASGVAWAAWVLAMISILPMCGGCFLALVPLVLARVETGRVYAGKASLRGAGLARAASLTAGSVIALDLLLIIASIAANLSGAN